MPTRTVATRDPHKPVEPPELAFPHCCCPHEQVKHVTTKSDALMAEAVTLMPGGVSSPVRAFKSVGGNPVVFDHVKGSKVRAPALSGPEPDPNPGHARPNLARPTSHA